MTMNDDERQGLFRRVQTGHSPYDNGWGIAADDGTPLDYVSAKRIAEDGISMNIFRFEKVPEDQS